MHRTATLILAAVSVTAAVGSVILSSALKVEPARVAKEKVEKPAAQAGSSFIAALSGCWEVRIDADHELVATWVAGCAGVPPATMGDQAWPEQVLRLPALSAAPLMDSAQTHVTLTPVLAQHGSGALLYLPANSDGSGYYVAAWQTQPAAESDDEGLEIEEPARGLRVGFYGAPPSSVVTPAGRVYLNAELSPRRAEVAGSAEDPDTPARTEPDAANALPALPLVQDDPASVAALADDSERLPATKDRESAAPSLSSPAGERQPAD